MFLSIIIPIYKIEDYLRKCLDSILTQAFDDYELILVNDGSPDACPQICDEYSKKYNNVKVIHQKNGGVCAARNAGLDIATGDWIWFIDGDDYIDNGSIEHLSRIAQEYDTDLVVFEKTISLHYDLNDINSFFEEHYFKYHLGFSPWNKWYKRKIIEKHKIHFDTEERIGEDLLFNAMYYRYVRHIYFSDYSCYHYVQRPTSAMHNDQSVRMEQQVRLYKKIKDYYGSSLSEENYCILFLMHLFSGLNQSGGHINSARCRNLLKKDFRENHFDNRCWQSAIKTFFNNEHATFWGRMKCYFYILYFRNIID